MEAGALLVLFLTGVIMTLPSSPPTTSERGHLRPRLVRAGRRHSGGGAHVQGLVRSGRDGRHAIRVRPDGLGGGPPQRLGRRHRRLATETRTVVRLPIRALRSSFLLSASDFQELTLRTWVVTLSRRTFGGSSQAHDGRGRHDEAAPHRGTDGCPLPSSVSPPPPLRRPPRRPSSRPGGPRTPPPAHPVPPRSACR